MGKISLPNSIIGFFDKYLKMSQKFSKTVITRLQRPMERNSFSLFLVSRRSPCGLNMSSNDRLHFRWFPIEKTENFNRKKLHSVTFYTSQKSPKEFFAKQCCFRISFDFSSIIFEIRRKKVIFIVVK